MALIISGVRMPSMSKERGCFSQSMENYKQAAIKRFENLCLVFVFNVII